MTNLTIQHFTDAGIDMLGQANAGANLVITKIVVGSGSASNAAGLHPLEALITHQNDIVITRKVNQGGGKMIVSGVLTEWLLTGPPYQLRELGVMARIGSGPERLYCVANVFTDPPDTVTPGSTSTHAFDILIEIQRATNVTVIIDESTMIDAENIPPDPAVGAGWFANKHGKIFQFKRVVQGPGIAITEAPDRVTIAAAILQQNVDLYVPANHPQAPHPSQAFPTIQAAHDYLLSFTIPPNRTATIHVYSGTHNVPPPGLRFSHPNSRQINLIGEPRVERAITTINYTTPTTKTVLLNNTAGLAVGQRVYLAAVPPGWAGGCYIHSIVPNVSVVLSVHKRDSQPNYTVNTTQAGMRLSFYPTVVVFQGTPTSAQNLLEANYGIGTIQNFTFDGGWYCLVIEAGGLINVAIINIGSAAQKPRRAISVGSGTLGLGGECVVTDADFGLTGTGSMYAWDQTYLNGLGQAINPSGVGFVIGSFQTPMPLTGVYINHCGYGILGIGGTNFTGGSILIDTCDRAMEARNMTVFELNMHYPSIIARCPVGLFAQGMSYIHWGLQGLPAPPVSPPAETVGNQNSFIHLT